MIAVGLLLFTVLLAKPGQEPTQQEKPKKPDIVWLNPGHSALCSGLAKLDLSPDGSMLASVSDTDSTVKVWNTDGKMLWSAVPQPRQPLVSVDFSKAGDLLLVKGETTTEIRAASDGSLLRLFPIGGVEYAKFAADGRRILVSFLISRLYNADTGQLVTDFGAQNKRHAGFLGSYGRLPAYVSPDQSLIAMQLGPDDAPSWVCLFDAMTGQLVESWNKPVHEKDGWHAPFWPGYVLPFLGDKTVLMQTSLWDGANRRNLDWLSVVLPGVVVPKFVRVLGPPDGLDHLRFHPVDISRERDVFGVHFSVPGKRWYEIYSASSLKQSVPTMTIAQDMAGPNATFPTQGPNKYDPNGVSCALTKDNLYMLIVHRLGDAAHLEKYELPRTQPKMEFLKNGSAVTSIAISPRGDRVATAVADGAIRLWKTADGSLAQELSAPVAMGALLVGGKTIVSGAASEANPRVCVWDRDTLQMTKSFRLDGPSDKTDHAMLAWPAEGNEVLAAAAKGTNGLHVIDLTTGQIVRSFGPASPVKSFSLNGDIVAAVCPGKLRAWAYSTGELLWEQSIPKNAGQVAVSEGAKLVAFGSEEGLVHLRSLEDGTGVGELKGHIGRILALSFSPDGKLLISRTDVEDPQPMRVWQMSDKTQLDGYGLEIMPASLRTDTGNEPVFSPDGKFFGYGRFDGTVVWCKAPR